MSTVLITGGTGVIGRHAAKLLCERGHTVRILSRRGNPTVPLLRGLPNIEDAQGDVRDPGSLTRAFEGCDAIVLSHQFQNFPVGNPKTNDTFDAVDRAGTENCVRTAQQAGLQRLVYISGIALSNANPPHPGTAAKFAAERAVFESGIASVSLRVNVVYAPDDNIFPCWGGPQNGRRLFPSLAAVRRDVHLCMWTMWRGQLPVRSNVGKSAALSVCAGQTKSVGKSYY